MNKAALFSVVLILFAVTASREVAMFTSFAATKTDYANYQKKQIQHFLTAGAIQLKNTHG